MHDTWRCSAQHGDKWSPLMAYVLDVDMREKFLNSGKCTLA